MRQSSVWDLPHKISRHLRIFRECSTVRVHSSMGEASDMITHSYVSDLATYLGDVSREVTASDGTRLSKLVNI